MVNIVQNFSFCSDSLLLITLKRFTTMHITASYSRNSPLVFHLFRNTMNSFPLRVLTPCSPLIKFFLNIQSVNLKNIIIFICTNIHPKLCDTIYCKQNRPLPHTDELELVGRITTSMTIPDFAATEKYLLNDE